MSETIKEQALKAGGGKPLYYKVKFMFKGQEEILTLHTDILELEMKSLADTGTEWDVLEFGAEVI